MKILHITHSLNPKLGGVAASISQMSKAHSLMGFEVAICCMDEPNAPWVMNSRVKIYAMGPVSTKYGYNSRLIPWLKSHAHSYDAVIVNGLWQYFGFAVWQTLAGTNTPYYVVVHGGLDPWSKRAYPLKHLKKWLYWPWGQYPVLRDARKVIFTSDEERLLARKSFWLYKVTEAVAPLGIYPPPEDKDGRLAAQFISRYPQLKNKRIILSIGRIHSVKGCDLLIQAFAKVAQRDESLYLVMAGPDQIGWASKLRLQAQDLGIASRIFWPGMLDGDVKWGAFYASEVFCLPSHQENFGIVVVEALACGKPVLISNKVNIWREIEVNNVGLIADDTQIGINEILNKWLNMDAAEFAKMQRNTIPCFMNNFHVQRAAEGLLEIVKAR